VRPGQPSRTALGAARHRAAHQVLDRGSIFRDPLALAILGSDAESVARDARDDPTRRKLRLFIAVRTRFAEDALAGAIARGLRQLVVLGAGLDTYAYRNAAGEGLRIFEVDHPATQAWKRERLADAGIPVPGNLTFAPVDFERDALADGLAAAGFDPTATAFFTWLGVVPYLTQSAVFATLESIATLPGGAHVVFDYANPPDPTSNGDRRETERLVLAARVAAAGESFRSSFETADLGARLRSLGLPVIEDLGPRQIVSRYFPGRPTSISDRGGHVVHAATA
jgi:methyltransferase (TIGR00027 family)